MVQHATMATEQREPRGRFLPNAQTRRRRGGKHVCVRFRIRAGPAMIRSGGALSKSAPAVLWLSVELMLPLDGELTTHRPKE